MFVAPGDVKRTTARVQVLKRTAVVCVSVRWSVHGLEPRENASASVKAS